MGAGTQWIEETLAFNRGAYARYTGLPKDAADLITFPMPHDREQWEKGWEYQHAREEQPVRWQRIPPKVTELSSHLWKKCSDPDKHKPREALAAIMRDLDAGELGELQHIIVVYSRKPDDGGERHTGYYQAGNIEGHYGSMGMLYRALALMGESK